jgi:tetratricopeptide (TPR) repeat protein
MSHLVSAQPGAVSGVSCSAPMARDVAFNPALAWRLVVVGITAGILASHLTVSGAIAAEPDTMPVDEARHATELIAQADREFEADPEAALRDAEAALLISSRQANADLSIQSHLLICRLQYERNAAAAAAEVVQIKQLLPHARNAGLRAGALMCEAHVHEAQGDHHAATALYEQAVQAATDEHDDVMRAAALRSLGFLLGLQGNLAVGLTDLREAQRLSESAGDESELLPTLNNIAMLYSRIGDFAQAQHIYDRVLQAQRKAGPTMHLAVTAHNNGQVLESLHRWDEARAAYNESLQVSQRVAYVRGTARALRGLAAVTLATGNPAAALELLERSDSLQRQFGDARLHAQISWLRGTALHRLRRLQDSAAALREAIQWFRSADTLSDLAGASGELAAVYSELGDWHAAFQQEAEYAQVSERILLGRIDQRFAALKVEYDTAAKERENLLLLHENKTQREQLENRRRLYSLSIGLAAAGLLSSTLLAALLYTDRRRRRTVAQQAAILGTLTHNLSDTVMLLDSALRIQFANRPFPGGPDNVIGRPLAEAVPPLARERVVQAMAEVAQRRIVAEFDASWPIASGELREFEQRAMPVMDGEQLVGITLRSSDVTVQRRMERAFAGAGAREAVGVGYTLHEGLAQELTGISLLLSHLASKLSVSDSTDFRIARKYLADAIRTASGLARLVSPTTPSGGSLGDALTVLSHDLGERLAVPVTYCEPTKSSHVDVILADQLCRITQAVLTYAVTRRNCTAIGIEFRVDSGIARLSIHWTGLLRSGEAAALAAPGLDLIHYQARLIGGTCEHQDTDEFAGVATVTAPCSISAA